MADQLKVTLNCPNCPSAILEVPDDDANHTIAKCPECGTEFGSWGDVKAKAHEAAAEYVRDMARDAIKDTPWIKLK